MAWRAGRYRAEVEQYRRERERLRPIGQ
jgi:hypothetical protein